MGTTITKWIDINRDLTPEELEMIERAKSMPIVYDEDCPELTKEQLAQFYSVKEARQNDRRKQTVTLRLSPWALNRAKSLGKGYTSVLSRILENALRDTDVIQKYL